MKDLDPNNAVVQYYLMMIEQDMTQVVLRREGEIVSQCVLGERHLDCSDWGGYGIQTIHVDDADHMYSDLPQNESLSRVEFVRISQ